MKLSRCFMPAVALTAVVAAFAPCGRAQDSASSGPATPAISGTGSAGRIAVWKNSTTLTSSTISQSAGNVGIGTGATAPAAKLEVNGNAQVDGNLSLSGGIVLPGTGQFLLWAPNDGTENVSLGLAALPSTTTGRHNIAVGDSVLAANTAGNYNTAIGRWTLYSNRTGSFNTASGGQALCSNTTGINNIALGYEAGLVITGSNNIDIGNLGVSGDNGAIRIGSVGTQTSTCLAGVACNVSGVEVIINTATGQLGYVSSSRRFKEDIQDMGDTSDGFAVPCAAALSLGVSNRNAAAPSIGRTPRGAGAQATTVAIQGGGARW